MTHPPNFDKIRRELLILNISSNSTIHPDGTVDVEGDVSVPHATTELPVTFGRVTGGFYCNGTNLKSLKGAPKYVGGAFDCTYARHLESLVGAPGYVGSRFYCCRTKITSLEGAPGYVGGTFHCTGTDLQTLIGAPSVVGGDFNCSDNEHLISLDGAPSILHGMLYCLDSPNVQVVLSILKCRGMTGFNHPAGHTIKQFYQQDGTGDIIACQDALIEAGYSRFARMKAVTVRGAMC